MAGADYYSCDVCGGGKVFYDANIDWEGFADRIGEIRVTCRSCYDTGVRLKIYGVKRSAFNNPVHDYIDKSRGKP